MKKLLQTLKEKLTSAAASHFLAQKGFPAIKTVEINKGQLSNENADYFLTPAVLVDYVYTWNETTRNTVGSLQLNLSLITELNIDDLALLEFYRLVDYIVERTQTENTGRITLVSEMPENYGYVFVFKKTYQASAVREVITHDEATLAGIDFKPYLSK